MAFADPDRSEHLQSYFKRSAAAVTHTLDRLDKKFVQPGITQANQSFSDAPIRSTFFATFAALSFLPLLLFVGFSLFTLGTCTFLALGIALVVSTAVIAFVGLWLAITLMFLFCVSLFLTSATLGTYLFLRYVTLVRADGPRAGSVEWARELKSRVRGRSGNPAASDATQQTRSAVKDEPDHDDAKSEGSGDDNTVVIEDESPDRRFSFKELDAEGRESPVLVVKPLPSHDAPATELDRPSAQVAPV